MSLGLGATVYYIVCCGGVLYFSYIFWDLLKKKDFFPAGGSCLVALGALSNFAVVAANSGKMPIKVELSPYFYLEYPTKYVDIGPNTHLNFLADIFLLYSSDTLKFAASIGDIFMVAGVVILILCLIVDEIYYHM